MFKFHPAESGSGSWMADCDRRSRCRRLGCTTGMCSGSGARRAQRPMGPERERKGRDGEGRQRSGELFIVRDNAARGLDTIDAVSRLCACVRTRPVARKK